MAPNEMLAITTKGRENRPKTKLDALLLRMKCEAMRGERSLILEEQRGLVSVDTETLKKLEEMGYKVEFLKGWNQTTIEIYW